MTEEFTLLRNSLLFKGTVMHSEVSQSIGNLDLDRVKSIGVSPRVIFPVMSKNSLIQPLEVKIKIYEKKNHL